MSVWVVSAAVLVVGWGSASGVWGVSYGGVEGEEGIVSNIPDEAVEAAFDRVSDPTVRWHPAERTEDYPGLVVHDGRVTGSITVGDSRLPLWAFIGEVVRHGFDAAEHDYGPSEHYGFDAEALASFLSDLLEARGEFGRLLLTVADAHRQQGEQAWWERDDLRSRMVAQLRACLSLLDQPSDDDRREGSE